MGTWATGIFADDLALDIRDAYRRLIAEGQDSAEATSKLLSEFSDEQKDDDDGPIFWLALALCQWELGRLDETVKEKAVKQIDSGVAFRSWSERSDGGGDKRRRAVLEKLRAKLIGPQPAKKNVRPPPKRFIDTRSWPIGEVFSYRLRSGKFALFLVADCERHHDGNHSTRFALLDWFGDSVPSRKEVEKLPFRFLHHWSNIDGAKHPEVLAIMRESDAEPEADRIHWLNVKRLTREDEHLAPLFRRGEHICCGYGIATWGVKKKLEGYQIDVVLENEFTSQGKPA
jgi:hypothetical protein